MKKGKYRRLRRKVGQYRREQHQLEEAHNRLVDRVAGLERTRHGAKLDSLESVSRDHSERLSDLERKTASIDEYTTRLEVLEDQATAPPDDLIDTIQALHDQQDVLQDQIRQVDLKLNTARHWGYAEQSLDEAATLPQQVAALTRRVENLYEEVFVKPGRAKKPRAK